MENSKNQMQQNHSHRQKNKINIDQIIKKLLKMSNQKQFPFQQEHIVCMCYEVKNIMMMQPMLLELNPPLNICGDFHGQFADLKEMLNTIGLPDQGQNYLFLGDYVDRGKQSLQCICLLFALKIKHPNNFFLLRGNHECPQLNKIYGFFDQCKRKVGIKAWKVLCDCFNCLPVAAIVGSRIFCVHGGLSPYLTNLSQINSIKRPLQLEKGSIVSDLLWSDPSSQQGWSENQQRGISFCYGPDIVDKFLKKNDFDMICRSHQVVQDGFQFFCNKRLLTIFSAPNYCNMYHNKGAVLIIDEKMSCKIKQFTKKIVYKFTVPRSTTPSPFNQKNILQNCSKQHQRRSLREMHQNSILNVVLTKQS